ncbi:MAG: PEP-CTERM sorting domain-containing protein [Sedimentisphaerales bacterium]|jgi:hypothetical protein
MKVMKNIVAVLSIIMVMAVLAQNALALPSSSFDGGKWGGYDTYSDGAGLNVEVVFNVYTASSGEFTWGGQIAMPSTDKYIYVYQVFNSNSSSENIESFKVLNSNKSDVAPSVMHQTCSQIDSTGAGISPDPAVSAIQGMWVWDGIVADKYSWYLIFSSNYAPTRGDFAVNTASTTPPPAPTPEPATMALFGIASALYAAKRGRKRQAV